MEKTEDSRTGTVLTLPFGGGALGLAGAGSWAGFAGIGFLGSLKVYTKCLRLDWKAQVKKVLVKITDLLCSRYNHSL